MQSGGNLSPKNKQKKAIERPEDDPENRRRWRQEEAAWRSKLRELLATNWGMTEEEFKQIKDAILSQCRSGHTRFESATGNQGMYLTRKIRNNKIRLEKKEVNTITTVLETITPKRAAQYLTHNTKNRRVRERKVDMLARAITNGQWHTTHQGAAFNCDGEMLDGQHRFLAIIKANMPVKMYVTRGLPRDAMYAVDQGTVRSPQDIAGAVGVDFDMGKDEVAIARSMMNGIGRGNWSSWTRTSEETVAYITAHLEAIQFAASLNLGECRNATIRAVIARAWYHHDEDRLRQFADVLRTAVCESKQESAAAVFRRFFTSSVSGRGSTGVRNELARKCECAIRAFVKRRPLTKLNEVQQEIFPVPGEAA